MLVIGLAAPALVVLTLRWVNPPVSAFMLQQHWHTEAQEDTVGPTIRYHWVDMANISPNLALAVVASEDQTFPTHHGFAWASINKAIQTNEEGGRLRGASTITQQTAKNLFLWPGKSYVRKGIEAYITVCMEVLWPKRRILEVYLNIAQFDNNVFGAGAAANRLLHTTPAALTREQAALLAAVLPAPHRSEVTAPSDYVRQRQSWILGQMAHLGNGYLATILR